MNARKRKLQSAPTVCGRMSDIETGPEPSYNMNEETEGAPVQAGAETLENMLWNVDELVFEVKQSFFETHLLPLSPLTNDISAEAISRMLTSTGHFSEEALRGGWRHPVKGTSNGGNDEPFRKFENLAEAVLEAHSPVNKIRTTIFMRNPDSSTESCMRTEASKPGCYGIRVDAPQAHDSVKMVQSQWVDVAVPGEFRMQDSNLNFGDEATKMVWSMSRMMQEDVRRRFVVGFTIAGSIMRYWFCSRSDMFVSEPLDILTSPSNLVDFILRISFASDQELGWDTSITLYEPSLRMDSPQYDIAVKDTRNGTIRTFRTRRLISNIGADILRGRGTRVWEAIKLDKNGKETTGKTCVLKDSWVSVERKREGEILANIRADAAAKGPESAEHWAVKQFLLTVNTYGDVCVDNHPDETRYWDMPTCTAQIRVKANPKASDGSVAPIEATPMGRKTSRNEITLSAFSSTKVHHRIVFEEIGRTIREVTSLRRAFRRLTDVVTWLRVLHSIGWVHRDISSENILVVGGTTKIVDLEYAVRIDDGSAHDGRVGTLAFMSTEVERSAYLHMRAKKTIPKATDDDRDFRLDKIFARHGIRYRLTNVSSSSEKISDSEPPTLAGTAEITKDTPAPVSPWRYNPLHDLESVFWLGAYLLFASELVPDGQTTPEAWQGYARRNNAIADQLFNRGSPRLAIMLSIDAFSRHLVSLHPRVDAIARHLDRMRYRLHATFQAAEEDLVNGKCISHLDAGSLYREFEIDLDEITKLLNGRYDIKIVIDEDPHEKMTLSSEDSVKTGGVDADDGVTGASIEDNGLEDTVAPPAMRQRREDNCDESYICSQK